MELRRLSIRLPVPPHLVQGEAACGACASTRAPLSKDRSSVSGVSFGKQKDAGAMVADFGQVLPGFGHIRVMSTKRPTTGPGSTKFGRCRPTLPRRRPKLARRRPACLTKLGGPTKCGSRPTFSRICGESVRMFDQVGSAFTQIVRIFNEVVLVVDYIL